MPLASAGAPVAPAALPPALSGLAVIALRTPPSEDAAPCCDPRSLP